MMKYAFAAILAATSLPAIAGELRNDTLINLKSDKSSIVTKLNYPGAISGVCGLKFQTSNDLYVTHEQKLALAEKITLADGFPPTSVEPLKARVDGRTLTWDVLNIGTFLTHIQVATVDGSSLKSVLESVLGKNNALVVLAPNGCHDGQD